MIADGEIGCSNGLSECPLSWPANRHKTPAYTRPPTHERREHGPTRYALLRALRGMGATEVTLSTNVPLNASGVPMTSDVGLGECPGAALYFTLKGHKIVLTCDLKRRVVDNLHGLMRAVEAIHQFERALDARQVALVLEALRAPEDG